MQLCKRDPLLTLVFDQFHAHPLRVPASWIRPLGVFLRLSDDEVSWIGDLAEIVTPAFATRVRALQPRKPSQLAGVTAQRTSSIKVDLSLEILGAFMAAFGAGSCLPAVREQFSRFRSASFMFGDARTEGYSPATIGSVLPAHALFFNKRNLLVNSWLEKSKRPVAYIIDSVILSNQFSIRVADSIEVDARLDHVPINALLDSSAKLSVVGVSSTEIGFVGTERLPFAITCLKVTVAKNKQEMTLEPYLDAQAFLRGPEARDEIVNEVLSVEPTLLEWK